jgi:hypothetical protein
MINISMARTTTIIDASTGTDFNFTSIEVRGDAFYGYTDGMHTIAFYFSNFTGKVYLEGTLANAPGSTDWFPLSIDPPNDYMQLTAHTGIVARTFEGNFMFLRVRIDRDYLTPANNNNLVWGQISQVLLNH